MHTTNKIIILLAIIGITVFADTVWRGIKVQRIGTATQEAPPPPPPPSPSDSMGAEWNPTGNPIGGGAGYSDSVSHLDADYVVHNLSQLNSALSAASSGDIIYVWDTCHINVKDNGTKTIKSGVTLASGRGRTLADTISWGALIYDDKCYGTDRWEFFNVQTNARLTGLRIRGWLGEPRPQVDTCGQWTMYGINMGNNRAEMDNCEIWGFRRTVYNNSGDYDTIYIHHNYFREGGLGGNYQILVGKTNTTRYLIAEANIMDYGGAAICGTTGYVPRYEFRWNITGEHGVYNAIDQHGSNEENPPSPCAGDIVHHNTVRGTYYVSGVIGVWVRGNPVDSFLIYNNWFYAPDSAKAMGFGFGGTDTNCNFHDNKFTTTPPEGVAWRIPEANIVVDKDSGDCPLTVKFKPTGSIAGSKGGYSLRAFYWRFGDWDTDWYARTTDILDSVSHTYDTFGVYKAEVMVINDLGSYDRDYVDINVQPLDGKNYLSFWIGDNVNFGNKNYWMKQCYVEGNLKWEEDVAGCEGWEHIVLDVTNECSGKDSVDIVFRLYCKTSNGGLLYEKLRCIIDDVWLYGGEVVNWDFESGTWTGYQKNTTDGYWVGSCNGTKYYCWDVAIHTMSGERAFWLQAYEGSHTAGQYAQVKQRVNIK